jgi:hypothetical protein
VKSFLHRQSINLAASGSFVTTNAHPDQHPSIHAMVLRQEFDDYTPGCGEAHILGHADCRGLSAMKRGQEGSRGKMEVGKSAIRVVKGGGLG